VGEIHSGTVLTTPVPQGRSGGVVPSPLWGDVGLGWMNVLVHGDKWFKDGYQRNEILFEAGG